MTNPTYPPELLFPPYGLLHEDFAERLRTRPLVPPDWDSGNGCDLDCRSRKWIAFRESTLDLFSKYLWPRFNQQTRKWEGAAIERMEPLTNADLTLLQELQSLPVRALDFRPESPVKSIDCPPHRTFYEAEDTKGRDLLDLYGKYDRTLDAKFADLLRSPNGAGLTNKVSSASLQFKVALQRPRPYQTAMILGFTGVTNEFSMKAGSSSMSSGHCLEGVVGVGAVMERIIIEGHPFSPESWAALEQHAVDIGDRRVFAGVHYPADNIASWTIALLMAPQLYRTPKVGQHLWSAISTRSKVFRVIKEAANKPWGDVYRDPLQELHRIAATL